MEKNTEKNTQTVIEKLTGRQYTVAVLAAEIQCSEAHTAALLKRLQQQGLVHICGKHRTGRLGKPASLWTAGVDTSTVTAMPTTTTVSTVIDSVISSMCAEEVKTQAVPRANPPKLSVVTPMSEDMTAVAPRKKSAKKVVQQAAKISFSQEDDADEVSGSSHTNVDDAVSQVDINSFFE